mmetsp:Transcript_47415/g.148557  ORF Transcript_47415/g.148557 Transcript_47415/m.148557 type:complete len:333 (-) Transcript_47415:199-1197(-)
MRAIFRWTSVPSGYPGLATSTSQLLASLCSVILPPPSYFAALRCGCMPGDKSRKHLLIQSTLAPSYLQTRWSASSFRTLAESTHSGPSMDVNREYASSAWPVGRTPETLIRPPERLRSARRPWLRAAAKKASPRMLAAELPGRPTESTAASLATARTRASSAADQSIWRLRRWSGPKRLVCCHVAASRESIRNRSTMEASGSIAAASASVPSVACLRKHQTEALRSGCRRARHQARSSSPQLPAWSASSTDCRAANRRSRISQSTRKGLGPAVRASRSACRRRICGRNSWAKRRLAASMAAHSGVPGMSCASKVQRRQLQANLPRRGPSRSA